MGRTYTLKQVASRVCMSKDPAEIETVARQIRHWTVSDLLVPVGEKYTGTGRSRRYSANEVRLAAWLAELSKYGMTVSLLETARATYEEYGKDGYWEGVAESKTPVFHEVTWDRNSIVGKITGGAPELISFKRPRGQMRVGPPEGVGVIDPENVTSVIVINLTKVFGRLDV